MAKNDAAVEPVPPCPRCGRKNRVYLEGYRNYYCSRCKIVFDDDPDEGGDYSIDPTRRMRQQEEWKQRRRRP